MAATYRKITASTFEEAMSQVKTDEGETLVVTVTRARDPRNGHIPVTVWQTFESHKSSGTFYACKG